jgi:Tfp pilus assembly major pilin PilA
MAEAKKTGPKRTKSVQTDDLVAMATVKAAETVEDTARAAPALEAPVKAQTADAEAAFASMREQSAALRHAMREALVTSAQGALEVNGKIIDAWQVQSQAAIDLWRTAATAADLPQAYRAQKDAARQVYETASAQWRGVAETATHWASKSFEPLQSALHRPTR